MVAILTTILSVTFLEIMLSIDNALVNVSLAKKLPREIQHKALYGGIALGAFFRITGLILATILITHPLVKILSALYLFWLAYEHLLTKPRPDWQIKRVKKHHLIITQIIIANFVFSIDNVLGIVGISQHTLSLILGIILGVVILIYISPFVLRLMHQFPSLEKMTYVLLTYIGSAILIEEMTGYRIPEYITLLCIILAMTTAMWIDKKHE